MSEDWAAIAADVSAAVADTGFVVTLKRVSGAKQTPWDTTADAVSIYTGKAVDLGIKTVRAAGTSEMVARRVIILGTDWQAPMIGDKVTILGADHEVLAVYPTAPGGQDVAYRVELST